MEVKKLIEKLETLDPNDHLILFDYDFDQFYRISELLDRSEGGLYIVGIKKTEKPKDS